MSAAVFQSALSRLICEADFAAEVVARGESVLPPELTGVERRRLVAVAGDPGLRVTRTLHQGFRLSKLLNLLPLTFTLLGRDVARREVAAFWRRRPSMGFYFLEEAVAFCEHLLEGWAEAGVPDAGPATPYLVEVVDYERAGLELQRARPAGEAVPPQWVEFRHDPLPLLAELGRGRVPAEAEERHCAMLGRRVPAAPAGEAARTEAAGTETVCTPGERREGGVEWHLVEGEVASPS